MLFNEAECLAPDSYFPRDDDEEDDEIDRMTSSPTGT